MRESKLEDSLTDRKRAFDITSGIVLIYVTISRRKKRVPRRVYLRSHHKTFFVGGVLIENDVSLA